ncbi:MAG: ribonuclease III [Pseudomonadota bacterium]
MTSKASEHGPVAAGGSGLKLGFTFSDPALLTQALTHRSESRTNNERLEFLGDSVLSTIISEALFERFPNASEGDLSRARARLVRGVTLARLAGELGFMGAVLLGPGERKSGGQRRQSILADALEAVIGAIYLEAGYLTCRQVVLSWFENRLATLPAAEALKDAKTRLQEHLQQRGRPLPEYQLLGSEGADHAKVFQVRCVLDGDPQVFEASGSSRRKAEQTAAAMALSYLEAGEGD